MLILNPTCEFVNAVNGNFNHCKENSTASLNLSYFGEDGEQNHVHFDMCQEHADTYLFTTLEDQDDHSTLDIEYEKGFKVVHDTDKHLWITAAWETRPVVVA